uniref:NADH-ubiquinone oxidoreductase chain 6 n=1 Tax=Austrolebias charrua TaxID=308057 RepID=A0A0R6ZRY2_9TELE|nr:NADH dehydrogenase subunit 6 [Austrolebias charrua]AKL82663.1 NADH dehydrogenase subunit 6 [Austrolebias charrua]
MFFMVYLFLFLSIIGLAGVASNPSPNYAALSLVVVAGSGCGLLVCLGSSFLSLILFLVYLGGMLVVFAYSIAFTVSFNLEGVENYSSLNSFVMLVFGAMTCCFIFGNKSENEMCVTGMSFDTNNLVQENTVSVAFLYGEGGGLLVISSLALLVALLVVLMVVRGSLRGALRVI